MNGLPTLFGNPGTSLFGRAYADFEPLDRVLESWTQPSRNAAFPVDVKDAGSHFVIEADLPGRNRDDIDISMQGNRITIAVTEKAGEKDEANYLYRERQPFSASRTLLLKGASNGNDVSAEYKDGVLTLRVKKDEAVLPKKIKIG